MIINVHLDINGHVFEFGNSFRKQERQKEMNNREEKLNEIIKELFGEDTKPEEVHMLACKILDYAGAKEKKENASEN